MSQNQRGRGRTAARASGTDGRSLTGRGTARSRKLMVGGVALGLTSAALAGMPAQAIDSNPPTGPGNIEIFPKRDMVAIEGYSDFAGKTAEIKILRGGDVIGSARGTVDGTGFLEVNHPGGVCWGAGTSLQVTPDIKGGDEVRVDFLNTGGRWDGARTTDVEITDVTRVDAGNKLVFTGTYGAGVDMPGADLVADPGKFGVEIVNPDMRGGTSAVGERAIGWPEEPGEPAPTGYSVTGGVTSGTDATGGNFEIAFAFDQVSDLDLAEAGEAVALGWQAEAPVELGIEAFYGMTLYEFHESSGPGFGGCPAGPQEARPNSPTTYTGKGAGDGTIDGHLGCRQHAAAGPGDHRLRGHRHPLRRHRPRRRWGRAHGGRRSLRDRRRPDGGRDLRRGDRHPQRGRRQQARGHADQGLRRTSSRRRRQARRASPTPTASTSR